jgi:hypothetical protein
MMLIKKKRAKDKLVPSWDNVAMWRDFKSL